MSESWRAVAAIVAPVAGGLLVVLLALGRPVPPRRPDTEQSTSDRLDVATARVDPRVLRGRRWGWGLGGIGIVLVVGPVAGALLASTGWLGVLLARRARISRRRREIERRVPDALELVVLSVRAGLTPHQMIEVLSTRGPPATRPAFAEVGRQLDRGTPIADALTGLTDALGDDVRPTIDALRLSIRHGTPISAALDLLADDVRRQRRQRAEAMARTLPIRLSFPLVLCALPAFVLIVIVPTVVAAVRSLGADLP